jgi:hypothetical protein
LANYKHGEQRNARKVILVKNIEFLLEQFEDMQGDAQPPQILVTYDGVQYLVFELTKADDTLEVTLIDKDHDFGDGYYTYGEPVTEEDETILILSFDDPFIADIIEAVMSKWESQVLHPLFRNVSELQEYIEAVHRLHREERVKKDLQESIEGYKRSIAEIPTNAYMPRDSKGRLLEAYQESVQKIHNLLSAIEK